LSNGEQKSAAHTTAGISIIGFVVVVAISRIYYQFIYVPQANAKPTFSASILQPGERTQVTIVEGAVLKSSSIHFKPYDARAVLGVSNTVEWTNKDSLAHTVTSDEPQYVDVINGKFDTLAHPEQTGANGLIEPDGNWSFTFTKAGEFTYHCEPHPWMKGKVVVVENFS
jgi:plastocyanin